MRILIRDMLEFSRLAQSVAFKPVDLNALVSEVLRDLGNTITSRSAKVDISQLPTVQGHDVGLRQVFQNLISNRLKFSQAIQAPIISVWYEDAGNHWRLHVRDNGIGFDPAHAKKAFALFGRLNLRDEYPGTGLGLSICRRVADIHGGDITVETALGAGATFTLTLPKVPPAQWLSPYIY